jgi:hypothetical protein
LPLGRGYRAPRVDHARSLLAHALASVELKKKEKEKAQKIYPLSSGPFRRPPARDATGTRTFRKTDSRRVGGGTEVDDMRALESPIAAANVAETLGRRFDAGTRRSDSDQELNERPGVGVATVRPSADHGVGCSAEISRIGGSALPIPAAAVGNEKKWETDARKPRDDLEHKARARVRLRSTMKM